jgi:amino acid transporter
MCEEVRKPATEVPRAIVGGVAINALAGAAFLIPVAFVLPDIPMLANIASGQPVPTIVKSAVGNSAGAFCLLIPLIVLGLICGLGCVTATSRATWAFARDGAIPGSRWWKSVNERFEIPMNSLLLGMAVELLLGLIYFGSSAAFNAFSGVGVIFLTLSYACPVAVSLILRGRRDIQRGSFNLGSLGCFCNIVCICEYLSSSLPRVCYFWCSILSF